MIDSHELRSDPRRHAAMMTDQGSQRGWCFVPEEPKTPGFVWKFIAWAFGLTVFFVFTPVIVRALMQGS